MKTKYLVFVILLFCIAINGVAIDTPKMTIVPMEYKRALLTFKAGQPTLFELSITNNSGETLYSEKIQSHLNTFTQVFDLEKYGNEILYVTINYGNRSIIRELQFSKKDGLQVGQTQHYFEPWFRFSNNKLYISFLNITPKNVYLKIFKDEQLITGKNLGKEMCIQSCFDLTNTEKGTYKIILYEYLNEHSFMVQK